MSAYPEQIAARFSQAATHYEQHASAQQQAAALLLSQCHFSGHVIDLGCGTGRESLIIANQALVDHVFSVDVADGMLRELKKHAHPHISLIQASALQLPFNSGSVDGVFSNFALQWVSCITTLSHELARVLRPQGSLHFAVPAPHSLQQLQAAGLYINAFADEAVWVDALRSAGFKSIHVRYSQVVEYFALSENILKAMKSIGANTRDAQSTSGLRGKQWLKSVKDGLECSREPEGLPLQYNIFLISAER